MLSFKKKDRVFTQGDATDGLFFVQSGKIQISVVSDSGKEATLGILSVGDFFGEGGLAGQSLRKSSAIASTDCVLLHVDKSSLLTTMNQEPALSALFMTLLLQRNIRYQDDLVDQLFNSSEKRLARALLLMAQFGQAGVPQVTVPRVSQETLAEMVGTTRSRVSFFMNRFRKLGFINYDVGDNLQIHSSLLNILLNDDDEKTGDLAATETLAEEPPASPGRPPDNEHAKRPRLSDPKPPRK